MSAVGAVSNTPGSKVHGIGIQEPTPTKRAGMRALSTPPQQAARTAMCRGITVDGTCTDLAYVPTLLC